MKKLLALACAGSVLALASAANAQTPNTSYALTVSGTINAFCNIQDNTGAFLGNLGLTGFSGNEGNVLATSGSWALTATGNSSCAFNMSSSTAGLHSPGLPGIVYSAGMALGTTPTPVTISGSNASSITPISAVAFVPGTGQTLNIAVSTAAQQGPFAKGTYTDVLTITVTAS